MSRYACSDAYSGIIWVLNVSSTMPYKNPNLQQKIRSTIQWMWCLLLLTTLIMEIFTSFDNFEDMCEVSYLLLAYITVLIKKYTYVKSDQLIRIFEKLDSPEFNNEKENFRKPLNVCVLKAKRLIRNFLCLVGGVLSLYAILPLFDGKPLSIPFSYNLGSYTAYFRWFQVGGLLIGGISVIGTDIVCAVLLMIAAAQIDILRLKLIDITSHNVDGTTLIGNQVEQDKKIQENLKECVRLHLCIIDYVDDLEKLYSFLLLTQYTTSMAVMCMLMMQLIFMVEIQSIKFVVVVMDIMCLFSQLILFHYFGNELMTKSLKIVDACYFSQWYYCDPKVTKMLLIMMERAKRPLYLSIYGFDMVTLSSFGNVVKWSYSLFALVRSTFKH